MLTPMYLLTSATPENSSSYEQACMESIIIVVFNLLSDLRVLSLNRVINFVLCMLYISTFGLFGLICRLVGRSQSWLAGS